MKISDFDYNLPEENIALYPPEIRGSSKLLVLHKNSGEIEDKKYIDISDFMESGDLLILNDTKVIKARLNFKKETGGNIEIIVLEKHGENKDLSRQKIMYKGKIKAGDVLKSNNHSIKVEVILGNGLAEVSSEDDLYNISEINGDVPIPPYLHRESDKNDIERYQTVFAKNDGSVAAPTASLNFTDELKNKLISKGIKIAYLTLHVGLGTFLPVREDDVEKHDMHSEYFVIPKETVELIKLTKESNHKVVALGTTVTRTLEYAHKEILEDNNVEISGEANIFIYPGYKFKIVDALITNFHAPRSTVLLLASSFAGTENLKISYLHAIENDYKFLSFGDSMMIL